MHIRTEGMFCPECPSRIERGVAAVEGVASVVAVRSMHLTSVLYVPGKVDPDRIVRAIVEQGFDARLPEAREGDVPH